MNQIRFSFILCFLIIILAVSSNAYEKKICRQCNKEITKSLIKANSFNFHAAHFICSRCKAPIRGSSYYYENDRFYDDTCYQILHRIKCSYCGNEIKGRYSEYENKNYHNDCYEIVSALPCAYCKKNIKNSYITYDKKNYHDSCYTNFIALRCSLCLKVIDNKYFSDRYGNIYHSFHKQSSTFCNYCGGYFDNRTQKKGTTYSDGRGICSTCSHDAVLNMADIEPLLLEVNSKLSPYSLDIPLHKISVHLVNKTELKKIVQNKISNPQGFTIFYQEKNILGMTLKREINIYLLKGVPKMLMIKIIAHEFNHVWQGLQNSKKVDDAFCEGSCNYASYLVLQQYPEDDAFYLTESLFEDTDPDYGEGFRRVVRLVKEEGFSNWISCLKKETTFPHGY